MAGPPPPPTNPNTNSHPSPPSISSQSSVAFTPSATSVADSSDNEFDPTPVHSPGGPQYDDLPPSYDDATHQAVHDARNGIAPIDPSQIEAHRITLNQGPNEPEIWEYRIRGEQIDPTSEQEQAPDYANHRSDKATSVPVQHVSSTENIPVGRMWSEFDSPRTSADLASAMLNQALKFTRHQPNTAAQYAPRLNRIIAIPGEGGSDRPAGEHEQFLCAYTQTLHGHSVEPDEFLNFLRGLNVLLRSTNTTASDLLHESSRRNESSSLVDQYVRGANEAFFAPRGLRISFCSEATILSSLPLPTGPGQRDAVSNRLLEEPRSAASRAQRLTPWIEPLNTEKLPAPSEHMYRLHEMGELFSRQAASTTPANAYDDPPHSIPTMAQEAHHTAGQQPGAQRRGNWSPFGLPGRGPFGAPGNGPFGRPGRAPFGAAGIGPFGRRGRGSYCAAGPSRQGDYSIGKEWAEVGKEIGKIGEEFGKMMGDLGMQFGQRANRFGMNVERMASGSSSQQPSGPRPTTYEQGHADLPPSYEAPSAQESGFIPGDHKIQPDYEPLKTKKEKSQEKYVDDDDDDDDASSLSSDSSDSDSDSDSDDEDYRDAEKDCDKRLRSIEESAAKSAARGTKTAEEISRERASAIDKVQKDKQKLAGKFAIKQSKRAAMSDVRKRSRQLKKEHRQRKRELRASSSDGKGKGKAKKSKDWKEEKKSYKDMKKRLRKDKLVARKEWRDARREWREVRNEIRRNRGEARGTEGFQGVDQDELVWLVVENLGP